MASVLETYLKEQYLNSTNVDINMLMDKVDRDAVYKIDTQYDFYSERLSPRIITSGSNVNKTKTPITPINHVLFAENIVREYAGGGEMFKSANLLLSSLASPSNTGVINFEELDSLFKQSQGLVELPIHTVLYLGALYDYYLYEQNINEKIDYSFSNGLTDKSGGDILENELIRNKYYGAYVSDVDTYNDITFAVSPFVNTLSPRFIDEMFSGNNNYGLSGLTVNYKESYFDYDLNQNVSLSNNISSHIPVFGYGVMNNYINVFSNFLFGNNFDGSTEQTFRINDNTIPYHIIGNFKGRLKTFKTYNDSQINFLASYNSCNIKIKLDLTTLKNELSSLTNGLNFNDDFIYTIKNKKEKKKVLFVS